MTQQNMLDSLLYQLWCFYYVDEPPAQIRAGSDYTCMGGSILKEGQPHKQEYHRRHERIDEIGLRINIMEIPSGWVGIDEYDYAQVDYILDEVLKGYPQRYFIPRIHLEPPIDWMRAHPEELCVYWKGPETAEEIRAMVGTSQQDMMGWDGDKKPYPDEKIARQSFSSPIWQHDAGIALAHAVRAHGSAGLTRLLLRL